MVKTRFDGSEKTVIEKVPKLAGKRNKVAQTVLIEMLGDNTSSLSHKYLGMVDKIGLYGKRIELLYISCGKDVEKFFDTVSTLYYEGVERSKIISMKTQEDFDALVKEYP